MTAARVLVDAARDAGATLRPRLWVEPLDALTPKLRDALRRHEAEIVALLASPEPASADAIETEYRRAEREAIEQEGRLPPAGSPERERLDRQQAGVVAGLLRASKRPR